jgi:uncharacterized protein (DUF2235 family)
MAKKLIVCADGTWNTENDRDHGHACPTNVVKVARTLVPRDSRGVPQTVTYVAGVGTQFGFILRGGALGQGLFANVLEGYRALYLNYEPDDAIYLFGFSRGAYTARSLAGLIRNSGLLRRGEEAHEGGAVALYRDDSEETSPDSPQAKKFRADHSHSPEIHFIGVWDTVGSLGIPGLDGKFRIFGGLDWQFHDVTLSRYVHNAYHALAIHERRTEFVPTLWEKQPNAPAAQVLEQVWFSGVHSDVGGGYALEGDDDPTVGLSDVALEWMIQKAESCGLEFDTDVLRRSYGFRPRPTAEMHDSFGGGFRVLDTLRGHRGGTSRVYRARPTASTCESIHPSVRERFPAGTWPESFQAALR